jgi:hypothetical protein
MLKRFALLAFLICLACAGGNLYQSSYGLPYGSSYGSPYGSPYGSSYGLSYGSYPSYGSYGSYGPSYGYISQPMCSGNLYNQALSYAQSCFYSQYNCQLG